MLRLSPKYLWRIDIQKYEGYFSQSMPPWFLMQHYKN